VVVSVLRDNVASHDADIIKIAHCLELGRTSFVYKVNTELKQRSVLISFDWNRFERVIDQRTTVACLWAIVINCVRVIAAYKPPTGS